MNADWRLSQQPLLLAFAFAQPHNHSAALAALSAYSPKCVEWGFYEVRHYGVLGSPSQVGPEYHPFA
jgi:hypothetical protein